MENEKKNPDLPKSELIKGIEGIDCLFSKSNIMNEIVNSGKIKDGKLLLKASKVFEILNANGFEDATTIPQNLGTGL